MQKKDCFELGQIIKTHATKGELLVSLEVDNPEEYAALDSVFIAQNELLVPFFVESIALQRNKKALLKLEDVDSIEAAQPLLKATMHLPLDLLPELQTEDNFYLHEIIGFSIVDDQLGKLGKVDKVLETGNQALIAMLYQGKEVLIPIQDEITHTIKRAKQELWVTLPSGLLEVYLGE